ncbi:MAG TPA: hypothetical protein VFT29_17180 [Gemmatimonadaceae bacterium]|nr:hypothetical protein [Gemmatimonadaceae bacterium]
MKRFRTTYAIAMIAAAALSGCGAPDGIGPPPPPPQDPVLLKDVVIDHLPAPFYHFDYDAAGRVRAVSFASDLRQYDITYSGDRISELTNNVPVNHDRLQYIYDDAGRVGIVLYVNSTGTFTHVVFTYDGPKLIKVERDRRVDGGFIIDKTMTIAYDADGNLHRLSVHRPAIEGVQDETTTVDTYEQYDTGINVDGFALIHDEFIDHLVLLPGVQLQRANPRRETRTGDGLNYVVDYTYSYDDRNRPQTKTGALLIQNGQQAGQTIQTLSQFTYY